MYVLALFFENAMNLLWTPVVRTLWSSECRCDVFQALQVRAPTPANCHSYDHTNLT